MEKNKIESRALYRVYGITEWNEKCSILSNDEKLQVLKDLKSGEFSPITKVVMLPFPKFIKEYYIRFYLDDMSFYKRLPELDRIFDKKSFIDNPSIGYILYLIPDCYLRVINQYIKDPRCDGRNIFNKSDKYKSYRDLCELLNRNLEDFGKGELAYTKARLVRYIHIMSYVDAKEAEALQLKGFTFKVDNQYRGFDMLEKLNSLNPLIRHYLIEYLGLNGAYSSLLDITNESKIATIPAIFDDKFLRNLAGSLGEFRNTLGYIDREYRPGEHIDYNYKSKYYKQFKLVELNYLKKQLEQQEQELKENKRV